MKPKVIKNSDEYDKAMARIEEIFDSKPGTDKGDELELLLLLVEKFEEEFFPVDLPSPLAAIRFRMDQSGLSQKDLIPFIGSKSKVSEVLRGKRPLSLVMIRKLVDGLGIPASVLVREEQSHEACSHDLAAIGRHLPLKDLHERGWFTGIAGVVSGQLEAAWEAFAAPFREAGPILAFNRQRVRDGSEASNPAMIAWRMRVIGQAEKTQLPSFSDGVISAEFMSDLVGLSYLSNGPLLAKEFLAKSGIHLVVERHLSGMFLDGAAIRMRSGSPLVALTLRHDRIDNFWFTLCHELAHVSKHLYSGEDVEAIFDNLDDCSEEEWEKEADEMAGQALIPDEVWASEGLTWNSSAESVIEFSRRQRIHAAIPAGRIRYESGNYKVLSSLVGAGQVRCMFGV